MTNEEEPVQPKPMLSPDKRKYWNGSTWQLLPGEICEWDGSEWQIKPSEIESAWSGKRWIAKPIGVQSEWNGSDWIVAPSTDSQWNGAQYVEPPAGVESGWDGSQWVVKPSNRSRWEGNRWRKPTPIFPIVLISVAIALLVLTIVVINTSGALNSSGSSSESNAGNGVFFYTKTAGDVFENGQMIVVERSANKIILASIDGGVLIEQCKVLTPATTGSDKYDEVETYSPASVMHSLSGETYLLTSTLTGSGGSELRYEGVDKDGATSTATLSPTASPSQASELSEAASRCPEF